MERVPSPISSSVLGQPPSLGVEEGGTESLNYDLDLDLQKLWESHGLEQDFIMNETVDERQTFLMDGELRLDFVEVFSTLKAICRSADSSSTERISERLARTEVVL